MRHALTTLLTALLLGPLAVLHAAEKFNVLFIAVDDLRPELGCYGSKQVQTPQIDKLAAAGTRFDRAYCQVPVCGASRSSLMTGILPTSKRFLNANTRADEDAPQAATLPQVFRAAGYTTLSNGKLFHHPSDTAERSWSEPAWWPKGPEEPTRGLDPETNARQSAKRRGRIFESPDVPDDAYPDGKIAGKTINDLRRLKAAGKPFFLACGFLRPHMPFYAPKKYWDLYQRDKIEVATNPFRATNAPSELRGSREFTSYHLADHDERSEEFHRLMRHGYFASTSYVDKLVGEVLAELDRLKLADNTIVVLWGDHGWNLGEHNFWGKHNTTHLALRVPLIVKIPGQKQTGDNGALVETSDIFPTLCELVGIPAPTTVQGRSFAALLNQPGKPFRDAAYSRFGGGDAIITEHFIYTSYNGAKAEMLYDLAKDPEENNNVAARPEYRETVKTMTALLKQRKQQAASFGQISKPAVPEAEKRP